MNGSRQRRLVITAIVTLVMLLGLNVNRRPAAIRGSLPGVVFAQDGIACDQRTVAGTYGFQGQGTLGLGTPQAFPAAETGVATADGAGNLTGNVTFSLGGQILSTPFIGTYQVNPDCTISETISFGTQTRHQQGVVLDRGQQIDFIDTDPGTVLTRVAKRVGRDQF
jgi:hypothetical protein